MLHAIGQRLCRCADVHMPRRMRASLVGTSCYWPMSLPKVHMPWMMLLDVG